jgi:glutamate synthase (NADPH) large chain
MVKTPSEKVHAPVTGLYRSEFEHDSCGIGFVANLKGKKSHECVSNALSMLSRMEHRGGTGFDISSGDGAGILTQLPHDFFAKVITDFALPNATEYGVGMAFFPKDAQVQAVCKSIIEQNITYFGLSLLGYRMVPTDNSMIGEAAKNTEPSIQQIFIAKPAGMDQDVFERKLFILRKYSERLAREKTGDDSVLDIISFSSKTIIYKGQLTTDQVPLYFLDLQDSALVSSISLVHSRFSTNTFPSWKLAQPFRYIAHNGEINTNRGNINWMRAREALLECSVFTREELEMVFPICDQKASDSANLDMAVELLVLSGRSLPQVLMLIIPEAWQKNPNMGAEKRAFYEFYSAVMEPWDGPASICFTDGVVVGATLDRNGLRPSRYCVTNDDMVIMASESGVIDVDPATVVLRGRLQPGKMFVADLEQGRIISDDELKKDICSRQPYAEWIKEHMVYLNDLPHPSDAEESPVPGSITDDGKDKDALSESNTVSALETPTEFHAQPSKEQLLRAQKAFGYTHEDIIELLKPMGNSGKEPLGSMGADNPLAVLSDRPQNLSHYFKQLFAQVTNPPIDPIREKIIMDLRTYVGGFKNILTEEPSHCHRIAIRQPVLTNGELEKLRYVDHSHFQTKTIDIVFKADGVPGRLERALEKVCRYVEDAIEDGYSTVLLSDRGGDSDHAAIPSLLAVGAVHHHLIRAGLRGRADIIVECGDVREVHHFATLLGYGASAINPYLALDTLINMQEEGILGNVSKDDAIQNYISAVDSGLLKIFSKMGISTLASYQGAQIFECLGLNSDVVSKYFTGTVSRIQGLSLDQIAQETLIKHRKGYPTRLGAAKVLEPGGEYHWRKDGERHLFNPTTVRLLQEATRENSYNKFQEYSQAVNDQSKEAFTLRGLLEFNSNRKPVSIDEVESAQSIYKRFATGAMSFGSISWEAHTTLAIAMNRLGGKSNSGEGGEDPIRYTKLENGDDMCSAIKQVASGRFGVTSYYLSQAQELQIKMAQGAKPGEGGHLPGHKVSGWIGRTRNSTPGVGLISPPPHHDIYSIEDLAQLIFDLKNANRQARVNVKLVSEAGVGTVAAGVCKAKADVVLISGYDGGTGASPLSSIKHAGLPWELGLAETHQTLVRNKLRNRIVVQTDGQLKTSRDVAIAALLGAEEWGIATAALIVEGCIMMRKCHNNTCPVGVATQNESLRQKYRGDVEWVVRFFEFITQGLREIMAELGFKTVQEMVGQVECLKLRDGVDHWKYKGVDLSPILYKEQEGAEEGSFCCVPQYHLIDQVIDWKMLEGAKAALESQQKVQMEFAIQNTDRTVGTILSNEISKKYQAQGLPQGTITVKFRGSAGQSFGAFAAPGIHFMLEGDANDYFGKGLSGAHLAVFPDRTAPLVAEENIIIGNVAFYGATAGKAFIRGVAGERFCVRNSGASVVVEGIGDHGCEYMTGGRTVILGPTGRNFGAGMSGGIAYVLDETGEFPNNCNMGMIALQSLTDQEEILALQALVQEHYEQTGSAVAERVLSSWDAYLPKFIKVMPEDYAAMLVHIEKVKATGKYTNDSEIMDAAFALHLESLKA